jgi:PAS domain S-box-containing protein
VSSASPQLEHGEALAASPWLQLVYQTAPVGLAFLSTDCRYLMINQHLTEICGISIADHIGRSVRETVPQVAEQVEWIVREIIHSGEPITGVEVNGQRPDGTNVERVWVTYWHPLKSGSGEVIGINVAAEEITERKRADEERAAMQDRLRRLNESLAERVEAEAQERNRLWKLSQDLLVVSDHNGTISNVNPAWTATLGWEADALIGKTALWLVHPDDVERSVQEMLNRKADHPSRHFENRMRCKDGSYRWLSWRSMADRSSVYAIARDITEIKQAQEQMHLLRSELSQTSRQTTIGAMTASIAHEIRQPLSGISANVGAAARWLKAAEPDLAEVEAALDRIARDTHRVDEVISSVRSMFGNKPGEKALIDVNSLIIEALALTQSELERQRAILKNNTPANLPPVSANRVQLQQVLVNLIVNSVDAMGAVIGRERILTIDVDGDDSIMTITVGDTGDGIKQEHLDRVFEPFYTTKPDGMGLGLSICRSIVKAHGGELWASRRVPFGTNFHMALSIGDDAGKLQRPTTRAAQVYKTGGDG